MLSDKAVKEYQEIYKRKFGKELSDRKAREEAEAIISMFKVIGRPIPTRHEDKNNTPN